MIELLAAVVTILAFGIQLILEWPRLKARLREISSGFWRGLQVILRYAALDIIPPLIVLAIDRLFTAGLSFWLFAIAFVLGWVFSSYVLRKGIGPGSARTLLPAHALASLILLGLISAVWPRSERTSNVQPDLFVAEEDYGYVIGTALMSESPEEVEETIHSKIPSEHSARRLLEAHRDSLLRDREEALERLRCDRDEVDKEAYCFAQSNVGGRDAAAHLIPFIRRPDGKFGTMYIRVRFAGEKANDIDSWVILADTSRFELDPPTDTKKIDFDATPYVVWCDFEVDTRVRDGLRAIARAKKVIIRNVTDTYPIDVVLTRKEIEATAEVLKAYEHGHGVFTPYSPHSSGFSIY